MKLDRLKQVAGAAVMQEDDALADAPERRGAELPAIGLALIAAAARRTPALVLNPQPQTQTITP